MNNLWTSCSAQPMSTLVFFVAQDAPLFMSCCHIAILLSSRTSSLRSNGITFSFELFFFFQVPGKKSRKRELRSFSIFHALCVHLSSGVEGFSKGKGGRGCRITYSWGYHSPKTYRPERRRDWLRLDAFVEVLSTVKLGLLANLLRVAFCICSFLIGIIAGTLLLLLFFVLELHSRMLWSGCVACWHR